MTQTKPTNDESQSKKKKRLIIDKNRISIKVQKRGINLNRVKEVKNQKVNSLKLQEVGEGMIPEIDFENIQQQFVTQNEDEENCFQDLYNCLNGLLD